MSDLPLGAVFQEGTIWTVLSQTSFGGALVPLAILLSVSQRDRSAASVAIARTATLRFSTLGVISVGTLLATGVVNGWILSGSVQALVATDYGRLLLLKVALFLVMLLIAAVNRLRLTPQLVQELDAGAARDALRQLRRNSLIEAAAAAIILVIVGAL